MKQVAKNVNILLGLCNAVQPSSPAYKEGFAYVSDNSRIDKENVWNKGPSLTDVSGSPTAVSVGIGNHIASLSILGNHRVATGLLDNDTIAEGSNGYAYLTYMGSGVPKHCNASGTTGTVGLSPPTSPTITAPSASGARQESGIYYYIFTAYNATRDIESLPSDCIEHWVGRRYVGDIRQNDVPKVKATSTGNTIRIYRSACIRIKKGDSMQLGQVNSPTKFYFVGEVASATDFYDYAHDSEIIREDNLYAGRGSKPPLTDVDALASFNNRMFYFVGDTAYYSSAGRPEEVGQSYTLTIKQTYSVGVWTTGTFKDQLAKGTNEDLTMTLKPLLDTGVYAEAKLKILELAGQSVVMAKQIGDKLWVWTDALTGYITQTANYEGFRFVLVTKGIGICSPWTLAVTPYGAFGADKKGIWVLTDYPKRLSYGIIDIDDSTKSTYCDPTKLAASFGVWVDALNEYWWSVNNVQIVYQADRGAFVGPYNFTLSGGCFYSLGDDSECYLTGGKTPTLSTRTGEQRLKFWLGQESATAVKDNLQIQIIYHSSTAGDHKSELITNGSFATDTGWTKTGGWTIAGGVANWSAADTGDSGTLSQTISGLTSGTKYRVQFSVSDSNLQADNVDFGVKLGGTGGYDCLTDDDYEFEITAGANGKIEFVGVGEEDLPYNPTPQTADIDEVSVMEAIDPITAKVYQNNAASETGAVESGSWEHTYENLIGLLEPHSSGRYFEIDLTIPTNCAAPIAAIDYVADIVPRTERHNR